MFPTLLFGFLAVAIGVLYALRPQRRGTLLASMSGTTLAAGLLGTCTDVMATLRYIDRGEFKEEPFKIFLVGLNESLHPLFVALVLLVFAGIFASVGSLRAARSPGATA